MSGYKPHVCEHGNTSSCPQDFLCQMRLGGARYGTWQTHTVVACDSSPDAWRTQVAPVLRKRNYETRVIRAGDDG